MSWLSGVFSGGIDGFKERMREWCRGSGAGIVLAAPPITAWLSTLPIEQQTAVREAVPRILEYLADKWFGG